MLCLVGAGALGMTLAELETVARLALPITVAVLYDAALSLIELKQRRGQDGPEAVRYRPVDFAAVAAGLGISSTMLARGPKWMQGWTGYGPGPFLLDAHRPGRLPEVLRLSRG